MIAKKDLIDGGWYRGVHRCGHLAVWCAKQNQFAFAEYSMGQYGLSYGALHPEDDPPGSRIALFVPFELLKLDATDAECIEAGKANEISTPNKT